MTRQTTSDRINRQHKANRYPAEADPDDIAAALSGRQLFDPDRKQFVESVCRRCEQKNQKRRLAGVELADEHIEDGAVTVHAVHKNIDSWSDKMIHPHWRITSVCHRRHPHRPLFEVEQQGTALVRAHARMYELGSQKYLTDVDIICRSKKAEGPKESILHQEKQQFVDDSDDIPDGTTVIDVPPERAPVEWTAGDRRWLRRLVDEHGPLERPASCLVDVDDDDP